MADRADRELRETSSAREEAPTSETSQSTASTTSSKRKILGIDRDHLKIFLGAFVVFGIVTFVLQNLGNVPITFIWTFNPPGVLLYASIFFAGMLLGWIVKSLSFRAKRNKYR